MDIAVFHDCRSPVSRRVIEILHDEGLEPMVIDYIAHPPTADELRCLLKILGVGPRALIRTKEPAYRQLGLSEPSLSSGQLIEAMVANPVLIDGPIVVTEDDAVLARPAEKVFNLL